jgi:hypothetical protein
MLARKAFFSFTGITDPSQHRAYNEWHQLDHRPENLALPGVVWGERWVYAPDCAALGVRSGTTVDATQYINMYWYREPYAASIKEWQDLAEIAFQWGRRPDVAYTTRPLMGFFSVVKGYVNPRVLVSTDVLPFRPTTGIYVTLTQLSAPHSPAADALHAWYDRERIPRIVELPGVAGAWTFASDSTTLDPRWQAAPGSVTFDPIEGPDRGTFRVHVYFLDGDPLAVARAIAALDAPSDAAGETVLFAGPLRTIVPWQWDWFD